MNESLKLNEKYKDTKNLQKREVKLKQLEKKSNVELFQALKKLALIIKSLNKRSSLLKPTWRL